MKTEENLLNKTSLIPVFYLLRHVINRCVIEESKVNYFLLKVYNQS